MFLVKKLKRKVRFLTIVVAFVVVFWGYGALTDGKAPSPSEGTAPGIETQTSADASVGSEKGPESLSDPSSVSIGADDKKSPDEAQDASPESIYDERTGWHEIRPMPSEEASEDDPLYDELGSKLSVFSKAPFTETIPAFSGSPFYVLNYNTPYFGDYPPDSFGWEYYAGFDDLDRCTYAISYIGQELMPTEERGSIGSVKPTGWHTVKYDCVDGKYLYNRCHLIGYQLTAENANIYNLVTGTRYLNVKGMLPFENMVADYIESSGNHVMYRATPVFIDDNLLCSGIILEGISCEDHGEGIQFCVFCYNAQPGVFIDYRTGESHEITD